MNYTLTINLEGAKEAGADLDDLIEKVGKITSPTGVSFSEYMNAGDAETSGEKIGKSISKGIKKSIIQETKSVDWKKIITGVSLGFSNLYVGSRLLSDELGKSSPSSTGGLFGKGGIAGFSEIFLGFKIFKSAVDLFKSTMDTASKNYSKALQSGMGLEFSIKRDSISQILGVSEKDVFRFGAQMAYLNPKLEWAVSELTKTNNALTSLSWGTKIARENLSALSSQFISGLAPSIETLISEFNDFINTLGKAGYINDLAISLNVIVQALADAIGLVEIFINGFIFGIHTLAMAFEELVATVMNAIARIPGLKGAAIDQTQDRKIWVEAGKALNQQMENWSKNIGGKSSSVPAPQAWMKQLPASHWEHMGLIMGGGTQNYAKETSKNTRETAQGIKTLVHHLTRSEKRMAWGLDPRTANP